MRFVSQIFRGAPLIISRSMARAVAVLTLLVCLAPAASWAKDDRWGNLNPKEKEHIRENYQRWQNLPPQDREHLKQEWNRFQNLPPAQQDQLKQKYEDMRRRRGR
jgi:hypothetical protein